jgi:mRNA interferase MazF
MRIERYGVYLADLNPTRGAEVKKTRPVVVVSDHQMNAALQTVVVCPLTTTIHHGWRSRIGMICARKRAEIMVDQIRAVAKERLLKKLDHLDESTAKDVRQLISEMYGE